METGKYQLGLVEKLSFVRYGGTEDELRAAKLLLEEIRAAGGQGELMDFTVPASDVEACSLSVASPFTREIPCVPYWLSGSLPESGAELKFLYAPRGVEEDYGGLDSLEGYAVLLNALSFDAYKLLFEKKAGAFITLQGRWFDDESGEDLYSRTIRPKMQEVGRVPGFMITGRDATELVRDGAETLRLTLAQRDVEHTSRNVLAVVPGTELPNESLVLTAHYDSVPVGTGSWGNATGAANLTALYKYFVKHPTRRTLRFIWCGSEEQGLLGSKAWIEQHEALMPEVKFCFNFDMCGTVLGPNEIYVTGGDDLLHFAQQYAREVGWPANFVQKVHSSDSAPFADRGVPALGITRRTNTAGIHIHQDLLFPLSAAAMGDIFAFSAGLIERTANARFLPVKTGMPDSMKEQLDKYFQRDKKTGRDEA